MKNTADKNATTEMNTPIECMHSLSKQGFTENFRVTDRGLHITDHGKVYSPADVHIKNFYRFEGYSDPGDSSVLYAIETNDGLKGVLTDAYGVYADGHTSAFISQVEKMNKI
jgi:hypothetical protein